MIIVKSHYTKKLRHIQNSIRKHFQSHSKIQNEELPKVIFHKKNGYNNGPFYTFTQNSL